MEISFEVAEQSGHITTFVGTVEGAPAGYGRLFSYGGEAALLHGLWLADKDSGIPFPEFAESFFAYLKEQGYSELWLESEEEDGGDGWGFRLEERNNAGWYPKYYFYRKL